MADVGAGVLKPCREKLGQYLPVVFAFFFFFYFVSLVGGGGGGRTGMYLFVYTFFILFDSVMFLSYSLCLVSHRFK